MVIGRERFQKKWVVFPCRWLYMHCLAFRHGFLFISFFMWILLLHLVSWTFVVSELVSTLPLGLTVARVTSVLAAEPLLRSV